MQQQQNTVNGQNNNANNKIFIIASSNEGTAGKNHHMESVNIYLQACNNNKKGKKNLIKKKKNLDLIDVCNESTIITKSKIEEDNNLQKTKNAAALREDILQVQLQIEEELKNMPESPVQVKLQRMKTIEEQEDKNLLETDQNDIECQRRSSLRMQGKLRSSQERLPR